MGHEGRVKMKAGLDRAADAVRPTLGAIGMSAMIQMPGLDPIEADDGRTILQHLKFKDNYEQLGLEKIRKAALRTSSEGGDGTATTTVLTQALVEQAFKEVATDSSKIREVRERLSKGLADTLTELSKVKRDIKDEEVERIALISCLDPEVATLTAEIIKEVGARGEVNVEKGSTMGYFKEVVKGAKFDRGYIDEFLVNDQENKRVVLESPFIVLVDRKLSLGSQVKNLMESIAKTGNKSVLFIADDVDGIALASLLQSSKTVSVLDQATKSVKQGTFDIGIVRNPYTASRGKEFLADMAALTGGTVITEMTGMRIDDAEVSACGTSITVGSTAEIVSGLAVWQLIRWHQAQLAIGGGKIPSDEFENEVIFSLQPMMISTSSFT